VIRFTGERIIPEFAECGPRTKIFIEHRARYEFALKFVNSTVVLDIACGVGYGAKILSSAAKKVTACDIHPESIEYAKVKHSSQNIEYCVGDATHLQFPAGSFDILVSFETIEHIPEYKKALSEFHRVLKTGGILILSSPNLNTSTRDNKFHFKEFTKAELGNELSDSFTNLRFYCQKAMPEDLQFRAFKKTRFGLTNYQERKLRVMEYLEKDDVNVQNIIVVAEKK
jgi:ubiquinone/menaquinone biosynthesis C-methylase UbiE